MNFACVGDCSRCPFFCDRPRVSVKPKVVAEEQIEQSVEETPPKYEVRRNIFGKEKVVMIEE